MAVIRNSLFGRRLSLSAGMAVLAILLIPGPFRVEAADSKPAKKDSRPASRPKEATFTTTVTPAEAKPGDTVTYQITAKIEPLWHIYKYSKTPSDNGPKYTEFDFFDPAGLKIEGDWTPSADPIKHKEPAFPDIPFLEYHEEEVTWSIKLKVPTDAKPGQKTLKCQAGYMLCSDQNCSFPGQWTLPDAELTILPAKKIYDDLVTALIPTLLALEPQAPTVEGPHPKLEDSPARIKSKDAKFKVEIVPAEAKVGETVSFKVTAIITPPAHIYKYSSVENDSGPKLTNFDLFNAEGLVPKGDWTPSRPPIKRKDNNFKELEFVEFYEGEVTWSLPLEVPAGIEPGKKSLQVQVGFMTCTDKACSFGGQWTLPAVEMTVLAGTGSSPAVSPTSKPSLTVEPNQTETTAVASSQKPSNDSNEIGNLAQAGLIPFLLACAGGGLFALAMPCVWPMIPVTVNFFVKQGEKKQGSTKGLAIAYCLSIIGTFMAIGLIFSIFFGATSLSELANNPWVNFGIAAVFVVFGLSLLGLFELRLPSFLLNASAQGESKGGMIGVMFMALTLTITSFTCTFPVVGGLVVIAAGGSYFYPIIGLATFATVVALPFFLLALSPGLLAKMPKSGDWMNTVKVVGGMIEIAAAFKFINTAECFFVIPADAWFNAYTVLTIWVVMALICGVYLLGLFRTDHDYEETKVGAGRIMFGWAFLALALFLAPALFGRPPQSKIWYLVVGLLPKDAENLKASGGGGGESRAKTASSADPKQAEREQTAFHGVEWGMSYEAAVEKSKAEGKPILIDFTGVNCANCRAMEAEILPRADVAETLAKFVTIQLFTDTVPIGSIPREARKQLAKDNLKRVLKLSNEVTQPLYVVIDSEGNLIANRGGKIPAPEFIEFLNTSLGKFKPSAKVAQGE